MKIAITGKGGVGKTTLAAALSGLYAREGRNVLAVDADPDANLGLALGFSERELDDITPISEMNELIAERTGSSRENFSKFFKINPQVSDIPDRFAKEKNGVKLLVMGTVDTGGGGCVCPEHVMLKRIISHLVIARDDVVIMDMEAGLEHLGRGTADMMNRFIVVAEPGARSIQTYHRIKSLAEDLGIRKVSVVGNKIRTPDDRAFLTERLPGDALLGLVSYGSDVINADQQSASVLNAGDRFISEILAIKEKLDSDE
jgi:CO dehydrogenase maturation factor